MAELFLFPRFVRSLALYIYISVPVSLCWPHLFASWLCHSRWRGGYLAFSCLLAHVATPLAPDCLLRTAVPPMDPASTFPYLLATGPTCVDTAFMAGNALFVADPKGKANPSRL